MLAPIDPYVGVLPQRRVRAKAAGGKKPRISVVRLWGFIRDGLRCIDRLGAGSGAGSPRPALRSFYWAMALPRWWPGTDLRKLAASGLRPPLLGRGRGSLSWGNINQALA